MIVYFSKVKAVEQLPRIKSKKLEKAVHLALDLYLDKHWALKSSIATAFNKHRPKTKVSIERLMREVIPQEVFDERFREATVNYARHMQEEEVNPNPKSTKAVGTINNLGNKHVRDIMQKR